MHLLDTDTVTYSLKGHPKVMDNLKSHLNNSNKISNVNYVELYYDECKSQRVTANAAKVRTLGQSIEMVSINATVAETFGMIKANLDSIGNRLGDFDLAIAATALANNLILVTNNFDHFNRIDGLRIENWTMAF